MILNIVPPNPDVVPGMTSASRAEGSLLFDPKIKIL
jgi:hypothetical protein